MKKRVVIILISVFVAISSACYFMYIRRTPEHVLQFWISYLNIDLAQFDPKITKFTEQWCPNGDGDGCIEFEFCERDHSKFFDMYNDKMKCLPISKETRQRTYCTPFIDNGYYYYEQISSGDARDYVLLIYDKDTNTYMVSIHIE